MKKEDLLFVSFSLVLFVSGVLLIFVARFLIQKQQESVLTLTQISLPVKTRERIISIDKIGPEKIEDFEKKEGVFKKPGGEFEKIYVFSYEKPGNKIPRVVVALGKLKTEDSKIKELSLTALLLSEEKLKQNTVSPVFFVTLSEEGGFEVEKIKILEEDIKSLRDKILSLETSIVKKLEEDIASLKEKNLQFVLKEDIKKLEKSIEEMNQKISSILLPNEQLLDLTNKFSALEEKFKLLEKSREDLSSIKLEISNLKEKANSLEASLPLERMSKIENEFSELKEKFSQITSKLEVIVSKTEVPEILNEKINKLEEKISKISSESVDNLQKIIKPELEEKIKSLNENIKKIKDELEDTNKKIPEIEERIKSLDEINKILISLEGKISEVKEKSRLIEASTLKKVDEKIATLPLLSEQVLSLTEEVSKLKEEALNFSMKLDKITNLEEGVKRLNERIRPLETQVVQRIASEVSELRAETSKEIKDIKDKISGIIATKSEMDIKFLSSRLNSLKENVDYLLNRKAEFDLKIDDLQKSLAKIAEKVEDLASMPALPSIEERLAKMEERIEAMPTEIFNSLKNAFSRLETKQEKREKIVRASSLDEELKGLAEKISSIESKLMSLEEGLKGSGEGKPLILE